MMKKELLWMLKIVFVVLAAQLLTVFLFDDPTECGRAVLNGTATWKQWCGAGFYLASLCIGVGLIEDKKKK